jgi:SAM-dependent methyltransferase
MPLRSSVNDLIIRWPRLKSMALALDNLGDAVRLLAGDIRTESGAAHSECTLQESVNYIEEVFSDHKRYGGIVNFKGIAAEIGPGDNAGVALLMRRDGCEQVDLIDRYLSRSDPQQQARIYRALSERHGLSSLKEGTIWDGRKLSGVAWRNGDSAEDYFRKCAQQGSPTYDFIISRAVFEHLYDPLEALTNMVKCLRRGGRMSHKIDMRDHGMFTPVHDELTWLAVSRFMLRLMTSHSGRPNRVLVHQYRKVLDELKDAGLIDYALLTTRLVAVGDINPHQEFKDIDTEHTQRAVEFVESKRSTFAFELATVDAKDLAVSGVFLQVQKR